MFAARRPGVFRPWLLALAAVASAVLAAAQGTTGEVPGGPQSAVTRENAPGDRPSPTRPPHLPPGRSSLRP